jgi:hypothetical protein
MHGCLPLLSVLCILGIVGFLVQAKGAKEPIGQILGIAFLFLILDVLVLIRIAQWVFQPQKRGAGIVARGIFGALASVGLFLALAVAVIVFFFVACGVLLSRM